MREHTLYTVDAGVAALRSVAASLGTIRNVLLFITRNVLLFIIRSGVPEDIGAPEELVVDNLISGFHSWRS